MKKRIYSSEAYKANPSSQIRRSLKWSEKNPEKVAQYKKDWSERNRWRYAALFARKKALKISGVAGWANELLIREFYKESFSRTKETGIKFNVDHVIPLKVSLSVRPSL